MIELRDVYKTYVRGKVSFNAINGITATIREGEFSIITGQSGSGKSTLMALVGCLDIPSKGTVVIDGVDVSKADSDLLSRIRNEKIGFIFQQFNLMPTLTALDNVALPIELGGRSREIALKKASDLLDKVGLSHRKGHYPGELSGGQMQRVAVARALSNDPEVILADEPTGNLDSKTGEEVMNLLSDLNDEGRTIILITHDEKLVSHASRHFVLKDGVIVKEEVVKGRKVNASKVKRNKKVK